VTGGKPALLVVSAHAADFVWRAGGYIAKFAAAGGHAEATAAGEILGARMTSWTGAITRCPTTARRFSCWWR
jgi:hypothetical protein